MDWFDALVTAAPTALTNDPQQRWGFLALLLHANSGDRITGLSLRIFGRKHEIALGEFLSDGCNIQIIAEGKLYGLPEYIQDYLEDINASDDDRMRYEVPNWRSVVHRYRLNGGRAFRDSRMSDLPDFFSMTLGGDIYVPGGIGGEIGISSDRYGNDYITFGIGIGVGANLTPGTVKYAEGYVAGMVVDWGTGEASQLSEAELKNAMSGLDAGTGIRIFGLGLGGEVSLDIPPEFRTALYSAELVNLVAIEVLGGSVTVPSTMFNVEFPITSGWADLDTMQYYSRSDLE